MKKSMKINWNWGTGIFVAIILFMTFIIVLVFQTTRQNYDLVERDYYPKALEYQQQIDKEHNATLLADKVTIQNAGDHIVVKFQSVFNPSDISGSIIFYRPSDKKQDIIFAIEPDSAGNQKFPVTNFKAGKYILKIDYEVNGKSYFQEEPVYINKFYN